MDRKPTVRPSKPPETQRRRRTAEEARTAILDAAEKLLVASGPDGIRLQEVAADVGVSHPTVLHHFGSREGLIEAVVARTLESLHAGLLDAVGASPKGPDKVAALLDNVFVTMARGGHARAFLWLALSGYEPALEQLQIRSLAEAVHDIRRAHRGPKKKLPPFEDTYFTVLLPALALLTLSVIGKPNGGKAKDDLCSPMRFRAWLGELIHDHLENG